MWPTRMPARLVVDSSVSSDHDTAPANFRTIIHDPQCQLQVSQAQQAVTFVPLRLPLHLWHPPLYLCHNQVHPAVAGTQTFKPCWPVSSNRCREQPSSGPKIKPMIRAHQFIDLGSLTATTEPTVSCSPNPRSQLPHRTLERVTPITTMAQWLRAFSTYTSVYVKRYPAEAPAMLTYMVRIMEMLKRYGSVADLR